MGRAELPRAAGGVAGRCSQVAVGEAGRLVQPAVALQLGRQAAYVVAIGVAAAFLPVSSGQELAAKLGIVEAAIGG